EPGPAKVAVTSVGTGGGLGGSSSSIANGGAVSGGRKPRVESGYFSLEKTKYEPSDPPQHLTLSSSSFPSSSSTSLLGTSNHRYTTTTTSPSDLPPPAPLSPPPLPSPGGGGGGRGGSALLLSPGYSTVSSSQSSLDSEPSGSTSSTGPPTPSWDGQGGGGGGEGGGGGGGGCGGRPGREYVALSDVPRARRLNYREAFRSERKRQELRARARSPGREEVARLFGEERRGLTKELLQLLLPRGPWSWRSQVIGRFHGGSPQECMDTQVSVEMPSGPVSAPRQGRTERRYLANRPELSLDAGRVSSRDVSSNSNLPRAKSLDRRAADSCTTPDLLNFKKGWMTKLYEDGMWKKHWFVLTDQSLRYYKDSIAEERNYGFQILVSGVQPPSATLGHPQSPSATLSHPQSPSATLSHPAHPHHPPPTVAVNTP
ncbi:hypothetical protein CRUP_016097, partial [Coryphaenoides rupestris]